MQAGFDSGARATCLHGRTGESNEMGEGVPRTVAHPRYGANRQRASVARTKSRGESPDEGMKEKDGEDDIARERASPGDDVWRPLQGRAAETCAPAS